ASQVEILLGSGSLANDAVGSQISLLEQPGLILSNGEFGERLFDHATRLSLNFESLETEWGEPFDYQAIEQRIDRRKQGDWHWSRPRRNFRAIWISAITHPRAEFRLPIPRTLFMLCKQP